MAMDLVQSDIRGLIAKIQAVAGTPETLAAATDGVLALDGQYAYQVDPLERNIDKPGHGGRPFVQVNRRCVFDFGLELRGNAALGTAAPIGTILRGCGFAQALSATPGSESAIYSLVNSGLEMLTIDGYSFGSVKHGFDARGVITQFDLSIRNFARATGQIMGLAPAVPVEDAAIPAIVTSAFQAPVAIETETFVVDLDGVKLNTISLMVDTNAAANVYEGSETRFVHQQNKYRPTGTWRVFKEQRSTFNPETLSGTYVQEPMFATITGGGEIVRLDLRGVQIGNVTETDEQGIAAWDIPFTAMGTTPTDCLSLSFLAIP